MASSRLRLLAALVIVAAGTIAYSNSFRGVFVFDEQHAIVDNANIRSLGSSLSAGRDEGLAGRPVVSFTFALNYAWAPAEGRDAFTPPPPGYPEDAWRLFFNNLWGYHALNLAIHLLSALLLYGVTRRTLESPRLRGRVAAAWIVAAVVAVLWVVHPLTTGSVTYVAQRVESLMAFFYLLTLYCSIRAVDTRSGWWSAVAVLACLLGMGTKEVMVSTPLAVLLWDWLFLEERPRRRRVLYAGLALTWVPLGLLVWSNPRGASVGFGVLGWTPWSYLVTQAGVITHYLRLVPVPAPLVLDYDWPRAASVWAALPYLALVCSLLAITVWGVARRSPAAFAPALFFLVLAPSSSVLPIATEVAAEHRMYLPLAAVLAALVTAAALLPRTRQAKVAALSLAGAAALACGVLTWERNENYSSDVRIWADTAAKRPHNARAHANHGTALVELGRFAEAEAPLRTALVLQEAYPEAHAGLGVALCSQGRLAEGIPHLERAVALEPDYRDALRNLGEALAAAGRHPEAAAAFRRALGLNPNDARLLDRLAWLMATSPDQGAHNGVEAVTLAERAVQSESGDAGILDTLAAAYARAGRFSDAVATAERALAAATQSGQGDIAQAIQHRLELYRRGEPYRETGR